MDDQYFFEYGSSSEGYIMWFDDHQASLPVNYSSAFTRFTPQSFVAESYSNGENSKTRNVNKRMVEFLKRSWRPVNENVVTEKERGFKHMMNERMRREKQKQNYSALHKLLPLGTKSDKNSIIQMANMKIRELQRRKEELSGRNYELEMRLAGTENKDVEKAKINVKVANPACGVESFSEVLKCLRSTGSNATLMHSTFSQQEFSAQLEIETKIGAGEVERAVNKTLWEVEKKLRGPFSELARFP